MNLQNKTFLIGLAAGAIGLTLLQNTRVSIGAITNNRKLAYQRCADLKYTTSNVPGRCSYHGGTLGDPIKRRKRVLVPRNGPGQLTFF